MSCLTIEIPALLVPHVQPALARLGYLHPGVEWTFDPECNCVSARYPAERYAPKDLRRDALYQLYREKIHQDTLSIRTRLYEAI